MTDLLGAERVPKDDARIEALGALDEAQSALGLARALAGAAGLREQLRQVEARLSAVMAEVATAHPERLEDRIGPRDLADLEAALAGAPPFAGFALPGETSLDAALHLARTAVRRAERRVVTLGRLGLVNAPHLAAYLNRLSSLLFALARAAADSTP